MKFRTIAVIIAGLALFSPSCKDEIADPNVDPVIFPSSNVGYSNHVQALFNQRCAFGGCHGGSNPAAGLDLTTPSFSRLMNHVPRLVVSGVSNNSLLIQRLDGRIGPQMPYNSQPLNPNQLAGIRKWIDEGAQNN